MRAVSRTLPRERAGHAKGRLQHFHAYTTWFCNTTCERECWLKRDLGVQIYEREKRRIVLKIPRCDTNGWGENEVTVTSGLHAQQERAPEEGED